MNRCATGWQLSLAYYEATGPAHAAALAALREHLDTCAECKREMALALSESSEIREREVRG